MIRILAVLGIVGMAVLVGLQPAKKQEPIEIPYLETVENDFVLYAIYERPTDYPDGYVVRKWVVRKEKNEKRLNINIKAGEALGTAKTLEEARRLLPPNLTHVKMQVEQMNVVETWI